MNISTLNIHIRNTQGQSIIELLLAIGVLAILVPALLTGLVATRMGKAQEIQRAQGIVYLKQEQEAVRNIRESGWTTFANDGTFHTAVSSGAWTLASGSAVTNGFTRQVVISAICRDSTGKIATCSGNTVD